MKQVIEGWVGRGAQQRAARERAARAGQGAPPTPRPRQEPRRQPQAQTSHVRVRQRMPFDRNSGAFRRAALDVLLQGNFSTLAAVLDTARDGGGLRDLSGRLRRHQRERAAQSAEDARTRPVDQAVGRTYVNTLLQPALPTRILHDPTQAESQLPEDTVMRAAANVLSLGQANEAEATLSLFTDGGGDRDQNGRYNRHLAEQDARDEDDWRERPVAALAGTALGIGMLARSANNRAATWSARLPSTRKGFLGEEISRNWAFLRGDPVVQSQVTVPLSRSYTRADHMMRSGRYIEAKFGPRGDLRPNQKRAQRELGDRYLYEHWMPYHVGRIAAAGASVAGAASAGTAALRRRLRRAPRGENPSNDRRGG